MWVHAAARCSEHPELRCFHELARAAVVIVPFWVYNEFSRCRALATRPRLDPTPLLAAGTSDRYHAMRGIMSPIHWGWRRLSEVHYRV